MLKAIFGYWKLSKKYGLIKAIKYCYSWYYGKYKQRGIDLGAERVIITKNGHRLNLIPNDPGISLELTRHAIHEPVTTQIVLEKLREGMVCVDAGGNIGYYATIESNMVGKTGKVIAIEPSPVNFGYLSKNLELQNKSNYEVHNFACGKEDGELSFLVHDISNMCKVVTDETKIPEGMKVIKIPVKKLDTFLNSINVEKIDFLRMDIEGSELNLFEGARQTIKKSKPMIQFEFHPGKLGPVNTRKVLEYLKSEDYELHSFLIGYLDTPLVGTSRDLKKYSIDDMLIMLDNEILPPNILLFLESKVSH
jgi:FkbM family methyltransferase